MNQTEIISSPEKINIGQFDFEDILDKIISLFRHSNQHTKLFSDIKLKRLITLFNHVCSIVLIFRDSINMIIVNYEIVTTFKKLLSDEKYQELYDSYHEKNKQIIIEQIPSLIMILKKIDTGVKTIDGFKTISINQKIRIKNYLDAYIHMLKIIIDQTTLANIYETIDG